MQSENELQFAIAKLYPRDNLPIATSGSAKRRTGTIKIKVNNVQIHTVRIERTSYTKLQNQNPFHRNELRFSSDSMFEHPII